MFLYSLLGFLLFRFFIVPNYNRFWDTYCSGVDCNQSMLCAPVVPSESTAEGGAYGSPSSFEVEEEFLSSSSSTHDDSEF